MQDMINHVLSEEEALRASIAEAQSQAAELLREARRKRTRIIEEAADEAVEKVQKTAVRLREQFEARMQHEIAAAEQEIQDMIEAKESLLEPAAERIAELLRTSLLDREN